MFRYFLKYLGLLSLFLILVLPSMLNLGLYKWQRASIKKEVKAIFKSGLKSSEISHFTFSSEQFRKLEWEESSEFIYLGKKFDLIDLQEEEGRIYIQAWLDDKESLLRDRFHALLKKHLPSSTDTDLQLIDLFKGFHQSELMLPLCFDQESINFSHCSDSELELYLYSPSPPPRFG